MKTETMKTIVLLILCVIGMMMVILMLGNPSSAQRWYEAVAVKAASLGGALVLIKVSVYLHKHNMLPRWYNRFNSIFGDEDA